MTNNFNTNGTKILSIFLIAIISITLLNSCNTGQKVTQKDINNNNFTTTKESKEMDNQNFITTFLVDKSPKEVFNAINNVRGWWSEEIDGNTDRLNTEFLYHYKDIHICKMKIAEFISNKKVVWFVLENHFIFTKDPSEWKNTKITFEISENGNQTQLTFTHIGLTPKYECYKVCYDGWTNYIKNSLYNLITQGKGQPNPKEGEGFNAELAKKWHIDR